MGICCSEVVALHLFSFKAAESQQGGKNGVQSCSKFLTFLSFVLYVTQLLLLLNRGFDFETAFFFRNMVLSRQQNKLNCFFPKITQALRIVTTVVVATNGSYFVT